MALSLPGLAFRVSQRVPQGRSIETDGRLLRRSSDRAGRERVAAVRLSLTLFRSEPLLARGRGAVGPRLGADPASCSHAGPCVAHVRQGFTHLSRLMVNAPRAG